MPAASQQNLRGLSFSTILDRVVARLQAGIDLHTSRVRIVCSPDDDLPEYLVEPGYVIRVFPPDPKANSGAGRYAYLATRPMEVWTVTRRLTDPGGRDDVAVKTHVEAEEAAINALLLDPQTDDATAGLPIAKYMKWVPGGSGLARRVAKNKSLIASSIRFNVMHVVPITVYRD